MPSWPRAVLFDFDGVIVNSEPLHFLAFYDALADEKIELTEEQYYRDLIGFDDRGAFRAVFELHGRTLDPPTFLRVMAAKKRKMMNQIRSRRHSALPGVEELVRGLWRDHALAICSGALRDEIEVMLEAVSLRDCFPVIVAAEDVTVGKPDPQGYLLAMKLLAGKLHQKLTPSDCLVVEDAPAVVRSVRAAGFPVLAVTTTYSAEKLGDANYIVRSLHPEIVMKAVKRLKVAT